MIVKPQQLELVTETIRVMEDRQVTILEVQEVAGVCATLLAIGFVGSFVGSVVRSLARGALGSKKEMIKPVIELALPASIPSDDLMRIADKFGWWAARLAESVCPHNDVACVEREVRRLTEARRSRLE